MGEKNEPITISSNLVDTVIAQQAEQYRHQEKLATRLIQLLLGILVGLIGSIILSNPVASAIATYDLISTLDSAGNEFGTSVGYIISIFIVNVFSGMFLATFSMITYGSSVNSLINVLTTKGIQPAIEEARDVRIVIGQTATARPQSLNRSQIQSNSKLLGENRRHLEDAYTKVAISVFSLLFASVLLLYTLDGRAGGIFLMNVLIVILSFYILISWFTTCVWPKVTEDNPFYGESLPLEVIFHNPVSIILITVTNVLTLISLYIIIVDIGLLTALFS